MIKVPPVAFRGRKQSSVTKAPPAALTLTAASAAISDDSASVTLQFDRAIDVSSMDVTAIEVGTISTAQLYQGTDAPIVVNSRTVTVNLVAIDSYEETNVKLFASDASGIVAVNDGGMWAGTGGLNLPFP